MALYKGAQSGKPRGPPPPQKYCQEKTKTWAVVSEIRAVRISAPLPVGSSAWSSRPADREHRGRLVIEVLPIASTAAAWSSRSCDREHRGRLVIEVLRSRAPRPPGHRGPAIASTAAAWSSRSCDREHRGRLVIEVLRSRAPRGRLVIEVLRSRAPRPPGHRGPAIASTAAAWSSRSCDREHRGRLVIEVLRSRAPRGRLVMPIRGSDFAQIA